MKQFIRVIVFLVVFGSLSHFAYGFFWPFKTEGNIHGKPAASLPINPIQTEVQSDSPLHPIKPLAEIRQQLLKFSPALSVPVINTVLMALQCADKNKVEHNHILAIIDYSLPSNQKRLWVFDLAQNKLLFNTYVSHGIQSGTLLSTYFSNIYNGKASSFGVFNTDKAYRGRHGSSLKLNGLDPHFNDNAYNRFIVMHGAWYVEEWFIKKYGRAGRSWGCPAMPYSLTVPIIDTIKDKALLVVYYPSQEWFSKSKFLNCDISGHLSVTDQPLQLPTASRDPILYVDLNHDGKREENEPILVMNADQYHLKFNRDVPLDRMLRRQINHNEYIALTAAEFKQLSDAELNQILFVVPNVKMQRGYWVTEMQIFPIGKIIHSSETASLNFMITMDHKPPIEVKTDQRFIRWVGL